MRNKWYAVLAIAMMDNIGWISIASAEDAECVRIIPEETDDILANPGMGWETFHRTANDDKNLPAWIPSTIHYARWGWKTLEPEKGKIDYEFLDSVLEETHEAGQKLAFRAMCCSSYPQRLPQADATGTWKTAPVAWETCWDMRKWVDEGWSLRFIFNYALALHGSVINNKSAPLPEGENIRPEVERFLRRLGYRLVLNELKHPKQAKPGEAIKLAMKWQNTGSAPCYRPYRLAYRLSNNDGDTTTTVGLETVDKWMPGKIKLFNEEFFEKPADLPPGPINDVAETIPLPEDLPSGTFTLSIAVVGDGKTPIVQLGIEGRDKDGWYPLSTITIVR